MTIEHSINSSLREKLLEHLFVGEVLKGLWCKGIRDMEVLKAEVDNGGYDLVMECQGVRRHIQLKSSYKGAKTAQQKIHIALAKKPSGCVLWVQFEPESLDLGPFYWFGAGPGDPLPKIQNLPVAKHSKGNANGEKFERPNIRVLRKGLFEKLDTLDEVIYRLFAV